MKACQLVGCGPAGINHPAIPNSRYRQPVRSDVNASSLHRPRSSQSDTCHQRHRCCGGQHGAYRVSGPRWRRREYQTEYVVQDDPPGRRGDEHQPDPYTEPDASRVSPRFRSHSGILSEQRPWQWPSPTGRQPHAGNDKEASTAYLQAKMVSLQLRIRRDRRRAQPQHLPTPRGKLHAAPTIESPALSDAGSQRAGVG